MESNLESIAEKVQALSDIELAVLICLVTEQHCIIETERQFLRDIEAELKLVGLQYGQSVISLNQTGHNECLWAPMGITRLQ